MRDSQPVFITPIERFQGLILAILLGIGGAILLADWLACESPLCR